jgi:hypothetical protein
MAKKGPAARVTRMHPTEQKIRAIPRDRDNTDDLLDAERAARARFSPVDHPANKTRKGSFDPTDDAAYNGNTVTGP